MFVLYEVLLYLVFIITLPFFLLLGLLRGKYLSNFPERMGFYRSRSGEHDIWLHAVSVGEAIAARTIVASIRKMRPQTTLVVTTTGLSGLKYELDARGYKFVQHKNKFGKDYQFNGDIY